jgi:hypothetical protein
VRVGPDRRLHRSVAAWRWPREKGYASFAPIEIERLDSLMDLNRARHRCRTRRARRLPQPAAGPANGGGSEVLSVVPPGGSSEAVCGERLRIDWNNRRALVRVTLC